MSAKIDFSVVRFLLVDPHPLMLDMLRDVLMVLGAQSILRATSLKQAQRMLRTEQIDVLITERRLEPGCGLDLVEFVRRDPGCVNHTMPIVMLTAESDDVGVMEARDGGVSEFLAKPFSVEGLYYRLVSAIARPRAFISSEGYFGPDRRRRQLPYDGSDRRIDEPEHVMAVGM